MWLTCQPGGPCSVHGGRGSWTRICFGCCNNLGQSDTGRESGGPLTDWPHCSCIIIIFPVSRYSGTEGDSAPGNTSDSPMTPHVRTNTHTRTYPWERKRSYDSPELRGQRLPLQMAHSHVQPFKRGTNHTVSLSPCHTHAHANTHSHSDPEPFSLVVYTIIHLTGWDFICSYEVGPIFSPSKHFLPNLSGPVH